MRPPQLAAVVKDERLDATTVARVERVLTFLGIPYQIFESERQLVEEGLTTCLRGQPFSVVEPITALRDECNAPIATSAHSRFLFLSDDVAASQTTLRLLIRSPHAQLRSLDGKPTDIKVSKQHDSLTGPMHGLNVCVAGRSEDHALELPEDSSVERIIEGNDGIFFFAIEQEGFRTYVNCSAAIPDLQRPTGGRAFDVKEEFLSVVPLFAYLKWAFREVCWQPNELGACLIIDDPSLRSHYGCIDFRHLVGLMKDHSFTTSIAFIPWNWRRTSAEMAQLIRDSEGRLSICMHGCNHTGGEFGVADPGILNGTVQLAKRRMASHQATNSISHEPVMVFPQGVFSVESLGVLQQHEFIAAVNTKVLPANGNPQELKVEDVCGNAILNYHSFPLFTRRYPEHGIENFAFDLLLGKPCLIVEHHSFFVDDGERAVQFIDKINSLNCTLHWRGLGDLIKRSYQWRRKTDGTIQIKMIANKISLANSGQNEEFYEIEKSDAGSAGVTEITINGSPAPWHRNNGTIHFSCKIPASGRLDLQVIYPSPADLSELDVGAKAAVQIAARRYLSEFRDNFLFRHERLMTLAQRAKRLVIRPGVAAEKPSTA